MSNSNDAARYVVTGNLVHFNILMAAIMQRNNSGETTVARMLDVSPVIMNRRLGLRLNAKKRTVSRTAWIVNHADTMTWLVWFGNSDLEMTDMDEQGNLVPKLDKTESAIFLHADRALEAIEQYVLDGICVQTTMSPGHLATLTG